MVGSAVGRDRAVRVGNDDDRFQVGAARGWVEYCQALDRQGVHDRWRSRRADEQLGPALGEGVSPVSRKVAAELREARDTERAARYQQFLEHALGAAMKAPSPVIREELAEMIQGKAGLPQRGEP